MFLDAVAGAVVGAAMWLQSKAGFGPRIRSFGLFSHASLHGMWFLGAFGRWMGPLPSPSAALAVWRLSPVRSMLRQLGRAAAEVCTHPERTHDVTCTHNSAQLCRSALRELVNAAAVESLCQCTVSMMTVSWQSRPGGAMTYILDAIRMVNPCGGLH